MGDTSRTRAVCLHYDLDPLMCRAPTMTINFFHHILQMDGEVYERAGEIACPLLLQHGSDDRLLLTSGMVNFFDRADSTDKTRRVYEGAYHEIYSSFEASDGLETDAVTNVVTNQAVRDLVSWLQ